MTSVARANLNGLLAILFWSSTALLFTFCDTFPPFMLAALTSLTGFFVFFVKWLLFREDIRAHFAIPWWVIVFCVVGIGGYRALYFFSLGTVPVVEASLINYLWPVLVVVFSSFLKDSGFRPHHLVGALAGFSGVVILLSRPDQLFGDVAFGHILALFAAVIWAGYSVLTRFVPSYTGNTVPVSFLFSGLILFAISLSTERFDYVDWGQAPFVLLMGVVASLGYFLWDSAMKKGHIQILGVASYFTPLISTFLLIAFAKAMATAGILFATMLIVIGPLIASKEKVVAGYNELNRLLRRR